MTTDLALIIINIDLWLDNAYNTTEPTVNKQ